MTEKSCVVNVQNWNDKTTWILEFLVCFSVTVLRQVRHNFGLFGIFEGTHVAGEQVLFVVWEQGWQRYSARTRLLNWFSSQAFNYFTAFNYIQGFQLLSTRLSGDKSAAFCVNRRRGAFSVERTLNLGLTPKSSQKALRTTSVQTMAPPLRQITWNVN